MRCLVFALIYWPADLLAQVAELEGSPMDPVSPSYLMKLTAGLLAVVIIIFFFAWLMKRLKLTQHSRGGLLQIIAGLSVGTRDRIVLLQVGDEQILIGLSPGRMEKLHTLKQPLAVEESEVVLAPFAQKINDLMGKGPGKESGQ